MSDDSSSGGGGRMTIRKSTFNKIVIVAVAALMISSFFGGYILHDRIGGGGVQQQQQQQQQPQPQPQSLSTGVLPLQLPMSQQQPGATSPLTPAGAPLKISSISIDGAPTKGNPSAPLTMIEFSDFQCPFCGSFFSQTEPQIIKSYVDTGKLKFVYKQFPLDNLHPNAREASLSSECANEQGKFWQYHDALFANQTQWSNLDNNGAANAFKKYAANMGLNASTFNSCLDSKKYLSIIDKDNQEGSSYGTSGTPTFYIGNDKKGYTQVVGAQPFSTFQQTINQHLQQP